MLANVILLLFGPTMLLWDVHQGMRPKTLVCILFCMLHVAQKYNVIIICSPLCAQVAQTKKRFDVLLTHCGVKFTSTLVDSDGDTSVDNVCAGRKAGYVHYVHTTYRSAENVAVAMTEADTVLSFFDESHRYTAQQLACLLEITQDVVLVSGTWRSIHADVLCNVDEDSKFTMSITEAERAGIVVPQRFVIPAFADMDIDLGTLGCEVQAEFIATASMRLDNGPRRLILYSATVADAKRMTTLTVQEFARSGMKAETRVLTGQTTARDRESILKWIGEGDKQEVRIVSSVHVLDEGIDVPPVDGVFISSIGSGDCRYVQRVCRSVRLYPGKTQATVLVWSSGADMQDLSEVFRDRANWQSSVMCMGVSLEESNQEMEKVAASKAVLHIEKGLVGCRECNFDTRFAAWRQAAQKGPVKLDQKEVIDGVTYNVGTWQSNQRRTKGGLSQEQIQQLNAAGFVWRVNPTWEQNLAAWSRAADKGPVTTRTQVEAINGVAYNVGQWQRIQRTRKEKLSTEQILKLEAAGFVWSVQHTWEENLAAWSRAAAKGLVKQRQLEVMDGVTYNVGQWQHTQRSTKTKLSQKKIRTLDAAGFVWSVNPTWGEWFAAWSCAADRGPVIKGQKEVIDGVTYNVGDWQNNLRRNRNSLSDEQKDKLEKARFNWSARHT
jgi:uncharacterized protein YutD